MWDGALGSPAPHTRHRCRAQDACTPIPSALTAEFPMCEDMGSNHPVWLITQNIIHSSRLDPRNSVSMKWGSTGRRGAPAHGGHGPVPLPAAGLWQGPALCLPEGAALSPQVSSPTGRPASQTRWPRGHRCRHPQALTQHPWTQPPAERAGGGLCPLGTPSGLPPPIRVPATGKTQQDGALT